MSVNMSRATLALASALLFASSGTAEAQWYSAGYPAASNCCYVQPVNQTCYQTVPVTEYHQVRQTVKRPIIETKYVEQPVTEYRRVVEPKTAEVQTVEYQNVTEYQTKLCNVGHWTTQYRVIPRVSPCEYDNRPDLFGMLNRAGYSLRMTFTPSMIATRHYVPQTIAQTIPVTRRIAIPRTRKITYNETRLVPYTTKRKVAIRTIRYVDEEVVALQPVTVMRTMPVGGTRTAFNYSPIIHGTPQTARQPIPDPISSSDAKKTSPKRTANSKSDAFAPSKTPRTGSGNQNRVPVKKSSFTVPLRRSSAEPIYNGQERVDSRRPTTFRTPSIVRVSGWRARRTPPTESVSTPSSIVIAESSR